MEHPVLSWAELAPRLIAVAAGREPADLVITGGKVVNVHTREILDWQVAIAAGRFAYVGPDASHCIGPQTELLDAAGRYVIPGLCDGHMHIESGMLTPAEFARAVAPHGTTTMFTDPHEIANVLGLEGVRLMHDEALLQPVNIYTQMPSCAPSAPGLETTGHELGPDEVAEAMAWPGIIGLGEMMNFPGVMYGDAKMLAEMAETAKAGKTIGGHYASPDLAGFHAYAAGGPADDHEGTSEADAVLRMRQGMRSMIRLGSAWYDIESQITAVTERGLDPRGMIICTDDCFAKTLVEDGHMNRAVRHAIDCGCDPLVALQMATINTATHFGLERELGSIAPGRRADLILTSDLRSLPIEQVIARGVTVAKGGEMQVDCPHLDWPAHARNTVHLGKTLSAEDFEITAPGDAVTAKVIGVVENQAPTKALTARLPVQGGIVETGAQADICQIALVERHRGTGGVTNGFVSGFGYTGQMAIASTVAHDSHHMIVVGTSRADMALAANRLGEVGGGVTVYQDGTEIALVELPIAGLMSDDLASTVATKVDGLIQAMETCGCTLNNAYMQHSLLALVVIPELRISDLGLVDVTKFEITELFEAGHMNAHPRSPIQSPDIPAPELFDSAEAAVERLQEIYATGTAFLCEKLREAVSGGATDAHYRAFYPLVRITTTSYAQVDSRLSFGHVAEPGIYVTTVTRPDLFRSYLVQQIGLLIENHGIAVEIGASDTPIPVHFALAAQSGLTVPHEGVLDFTLRDVFDVPILSTMNDDIVNGYGDPYEENEHPLAPFSAQRVDYSLARLSHYTATEAEHFQNHVLFTNYQFYVGVFEDYARAMLADPESGYTSFVGPAMSRSPAPKTPAPAPEKLPQMPSYHLKRADGGGITLVNIGVGPSNAKTATDHIAVLRPHAWLMVGHCGGLRNSQRLGDFVLAHSYLREDHVLDDDLPVWVPIPPLAEIQVALETAVAEETQLEGYDLKRIMRTGTVATIDNRNWELRDQSGPVQRLSQSRAIAMDMESATIAANGFRFRVPYGTLLCVSDKPLHGELKLPGMASEFYRTQVANHLKIGIKAMEILRDMPLERIHSRKLRSFQETAFL